MKSVGEAMAIGRNFTTALQKSLRSLEKPEAVFSWPASQADVDVDALLSSWAHGKTKPHPTIFRAVLERLADDLDIAPDGKIWFSEATVRYEIHDWPIDALEARGNGRIICHDPKTGKTRTMIRGLIFPNGVCIGNDQQSIIFSETWGCTVKRYYFDGPKKGKIEVMMENLPGYPDNINWASDGNYWMSLLGMRSPALDLAWKMPGFRKRMSKRVPRDEWLFPNVNVGCVLKFNDKGEVLDVLWDLGAKNHPQITSMREHRGHLYLGGLTNNRIGRYKIPEGQCDPDYVQYDRRWGKEAPGKGAKATRAADQEQTVKADQS